MKRITKTKLVALFKRHGFKLDSVETTAGASKAWMRGTVDGRAMTLEELRAAIMAATLDAEREHGRRAAVSEMRDDEEFFYRADDYTVETQTTQLNNGEPGQIFIAVHAGRPRGVEYEYGIDC